MLDGSDAIAKVAYEVDILSGGSEQIVLSQAMQQARTTLATVATIMQ